MKNWDKIVQSEGINNVNFLHFMSTGKRAFQKDGFRETLTSKF